MSTKVSREFRPNRGPQTEFWKSQARIIGYGGAMGGGKSRAICEKALEYAMTCPGVQILIGRQKHTSIIETTKKTMLEEVVPHELIARQKSSMGEDFIDLYTPKKGVTSRVNFVGLDDPVRWYSAQIGVLIVDQVEEVAEDTIVKLMTRLRDPKAPVGHFTGKIGLPDENGRLVPTQVVDFPIAGKVILSFNPENPGHWLQRWFILGSSQSDFGFRKAELYASDAEFPMGDAEFFFAKATDNPHLAPGYVAAQLAGMPEHLRRRYLDGKWEYISGACYFDTAALGEYQERVTRPKWIGHTETDKNGKHRLVNRNEGPWHIWEAPVRGDNPHRYVVSVDVSSGGSTDYTGIQVVSIENFQQVAEFQGKLDPDLAAKEAFRIGKIYNDALIAPEVTGGWGFTITRELERLGYRRIYTRKGWDRIKKQWSDKLGWDTTAANRAHMLDTLERVLRELEFDLRSERSLAELGAFVRDDKGRPAAQPGMNDDLVISLAIAVTVALEMPRQLRKVRQTPHRPATSSVTGY